MTRPLRVVHVITTLSAGGAERQLELLVDHSAADTSTVALYAGGPVAESLRAAGHPVQVLALPGRRRALTLPVLAWRLWRARPDVVHLHLLSAQLWGVPAARLARVPVVVSTEHSLMETTIEGRPHTWWLRLLYRLLERGTTHTVAVSETTAQRLEGWRVARSRISVIDNGIDVDALDLGPAVRAQARDELGLGSDLTVVVVARLEPVKRVDEVLEACAPRLRAGGCVLLVVGAGPLRERLQEQAQQLGVAAAVRFLGARGDVPRLLAAADLAVSASQDETFGMAVVEAVASGLPVVYAQCPALEELPEQPPGAVQAHPGTLGSAVGTLLAQQPGRHPVPEALRERYGIAATAARVDALYEQLADGRVRR